MKSKHTDKYLQKVYFRFVALDINIYAPDGGFGAANTCLRAGTLLDLDLDELADLI